MKRYKVTVLKKVFTESYRNEKGQIVPAKTEILADAEAKARKVTVGEESVEVQPGKVQELPDAVAVYLNKHRFYELEEAGRKSE